MGESEGSRKKDSAFAFVVVFVFWASLFGFVAWIITPGAKNEEPPTTQDIAQSSPATLLEFDKRTWEDFKHLYTMHNTFMEAIGLYIPGKNDLLLYNVCVTHEEYFKNISFNYGTNSYERTYLSAFESVAYFEQMTARALIKYMDSGKVSDQASVAQNIQAAKTALIKITYNRGSLLTEAGLTYDEKQKKIDDDMAEFETS